MTDAEISYAEEIERLKCTTHLLEERQTELEAELEAADKTS